VAQRAEYTAKLINSRWLSDQTRHFEFETKELERFDFKAGQFVSMMAMRGDRKETRAYSIASPPRSNSSFDLCLNRVQDGFFSNYLCDLEDGAEVKFHGPHGLFLLRNPLRDSIFIATGTGIAPMRSFLDWIFADEARHAGKNFWLVYGTRYDKDIYYQEEFERLAEQHPNFKYLITISRPSEAWKGRKGYVQELVRQIMEGRAEDQRTNLDAYICGLNNMVSAQRELLTGFGWDKKQIVFERYD